MTATMTITPWYQRPTSWPMDFIGTTKFVEKMKIFEKKEGVSIPTGVGMVPNNQFGPSPPAYFIFVMTPFGDMRIEVSRKVFGLLQIGESIVISYRKGRWSGALKGEIAR